MLKVFRLPSKAKECWEQRYECVWMCLELHLITAQPSLNVQGFCLMSSNEMKFKTIQSDPKNLQDSSQAP